MVKNEKKQVFIDVVKKGLSHIPTIISAVLFPPIVEGTEIIMNTIEKKMKQIEKRLMRNMHYNLIIFFGGILLIVALLFFLIEHLSWTKTSSFFSVGITIFVIGLLLKLSEPKN